MPHAHAEAQLVEPPAIGLIGELRWQVAVQNPNAVVAGEPRDAGFLGRETKGDVVLVSRLRAALERLYPALAAEAIHHAQRQTPNSPRPGGAPANGIRAEQGRGAVRRTDFWVGSQATGILPAAFFRTIPHRKPSELFATAPFWSQPRTVVFVNVYKAMAHVFVVVPKVPDRVQLPAYGPGSYQWLLNGQPVLNESNTTLTVANATRLQAGQFQAVIKNRAGPATTQAASVRVTPVLDIQRLENGFVIIVLTDSRTSNWQVEASSDLATWARLGARIYTDVQGVFLDATAAGKERRCYLRLVIQD